MYPQAFSVTVPVVEVMRLMFGMSACRKVPVLLGVFGSIITNTNACTLCFISVDIMYSLFTLIRSSYSLIQALAAEY